MQPLGGIRSTVRGFGRGAAWVGVLAALLVAVLAAQVGSAAGVPARSVVAVWHDAPWCQLTKLVKVDPTTLRVVHGPALTLDDFYSGPVISPDASRVALGGFNFARVVVVDVARLRRQATVRIGDRGEWAQLLAWPAARRIVALDVLSDAHRVALTKVVVLDPATRRVAARLPVRWWAAQGSGVTGRGRVAVLLVSWLRLAPPRLVVVGRDGIIRQVVLSRLRAGIGYEGGGDSVRFPGFAVDPAGERAFVIDEGEPVASVDLRTLRVRYHRVSGLAVPDRAAAAPAEEMGTSNPRRGPSRTAGWLGGGLLAVSGSDSYTGRTRSGRVGDSWSPAGLQLLDTRSWQVRTVASRVSSFEQAGGTILARPWAWDASRHSFAGDALAAYSHTGRLLYRIPNPTRSVTLTWQLVLGRLVVLGPDRKARVIDRSTGRTSMHLTSAQAERLYDPGYC